MKELIEWPLRMRTITGYGIAVILVFAALNGGAWAAGWPARLRLLPVFSAGFVLGMIGMYIAARGYGYHQ
jgi:hypothetical protein